MKDVVSTYHQEQEARLESSVNTGIILTVGVSLLMANR